MTGLIFNYFAGETITAFYSLTIPWTGIGKEFWRGRQDRSLRIFSKPSVINRFGIPLPTIVWVGLAMIFSLAWWVVEDFSLGLNDNCFLYLLAVGGVGCSVVCLLQISWGPQIYMNFAGSFVWRLASSWSPLCSSFATFWYECENNGKALQKVRHESSSMSLAWRAIR